MMKLEILNIYSRLYYNAIVIDIFSKIEICIYIHHFELQNVYKKLKRLKNTVGLKVPFNVWNFNKRNSINEINFVLTGFCSATIGYCENAKMGFSSNRLIRNQHFSRISYNYERFRKMKFLSISKLVEITYFICN